MKTKPNEGVVAAHTVPETDRPPVDFTKEWTNGHKFFTSQQSIAFVELLHTEERTRERHARNRHLMARPRNPLNGDPTPRDARGETVLNPKLLHTVKSGVPLYVEHDLTASQAVLNRFITKEPQGKIGVPEEKYQVLGNTEGIPFPSATQGDLFNATSTFHQKKAEKLAEREKINEHIAREKALRHQKELARQMKILQKQMDEKEKEMTFIRTQYHL